MPSIPSFSTAKDLMCATRNAAQDNERIEWQLKQMRAREQIRAQSYQPRIMGGGDKDATHATDARIDFEKRIKHRLDENTALIAFTTSILYGKDGCTGGLATLLSPVHADCLWWRYCNSATWKQTAQSCDMSERWCLIGWHLAKRLVLIQAASGQVSAVPPSCLVKI